MYVISDTSRPHVAVGMAATLQGIAVALAPRSEPNLVVLVNEDGLSRGLHEDERRELDERVGAVRLIAEESAGSGGADRGILAYSPGSRENPLAGLRPWWSVTGYARTNDNCDAAGRSHGGSSPSP